MGAKLSPDPAWAFRRKLGERIDSSTDRRADCRFIRQSGELFVLFGVFNRRALSRAVVVLSAKARRCAACREW